jgi:hypothetical protein
MRRVTKKARPVSSQRQLEHYVFGSDRHRSDKTVADRLRATEYVPTTVVVPERESFPRAGDLAENLVRVVHEGELRWKEADQGAYLEALKPHIKKGAGEYQIPKSSGGKILTKKNGDPVMQKYRTKAMRDVYISLPPWVAEAAADLMDYEGGPAKVRRMVEQAALAAAEVLEARTGYKAVGLAVHPDSRLQIGVHIQFLTVENGQLLGRSKSGLGGKGGVGRRGLRLAGDVNCALHRFNKVRPGKVDGNWFKSVGTRDYDDIAMLDAMDARIKELMPNIDYGKEHYVDDWLERRKKSRELIEKEAEELAQENQALKQTNEKLRSRIGLLEKSLSLTSLKTATNKEPIPVIPVDKDGSRSGLRYSRDNRDGHDGDL